MDVHHLSIFLAVAEELHFGRAAQRLHMAQPPVSRSIAQLEKQYGISLFERSTRTVKLTPVGVQLVPYAKKVLRSVKEFEDKIHATKSGDSGTIRIAFSGVSTYLLVGELSRGLKRQHPGITPTFISDYFANDALDMLMDGHADIVLGRWDFVPPHLESVVVLRESLVLALPASHPLAERSWVNMRELRKEPFIVLNSSQSVLLYRLRRLAHDAKFEPNILQEAGDTSTVIALVGAEIGISLTLDSVQQNVHDPNIKFVPVADESDPVELRMAWAPDNMNPALSKTLATASEVWSL